ncbi:filamentous hemagglutinin [Pantoea sp. PSNIH3]|nr:filamentous hemagglutinin [Pantoea sp. PSNIH5]POY66161.1 filamentous hemagglutinin [Pantoea sp. PSNIH3]
MNRLLYRVVFNKARGMLMLVAEIARACSGGSASSGIVHTLCRLVCRLRALSFSLWLAIGAVHTAQAAIVADKSAPGKQQPTVLVTANGTPQINIQTPSAGGVSRNTYSQFDVDKKGVILNNARRNTSTQLGGMVSANPWMAKGEAKIILNEVNARAPSRLNGYIEVAGQKAQVVIASPAGITCNGCGFINAGRATLTTGTAQLQNGNLTGYQVDRGEVVIEGKGLDASRQDYTDIIARAVKVNAAINAKELTMTAGRNQVDAAHEKITALADNGSAKPQLAVDVSQVGGMYAGKIRLRATERGVGVRNAGTVGSEAGLVTLTADGRIENRGEFSSQGSLQLSSATGISSSGRMLSQQELAVKSAGDISNSGSVWSSADVTMAASGELQNSGSIAARHNVTLSGSRLISGSKSTLAAGAQSDGRVSNSGELTLMAAGKLEMNGLNLAGGNLNASGQGLDAAGSQTQAKNITLDAKQGGLNTAAAQVIADGTLIAATAGTLNNAAGRLAANKLSVTARRLDNQQGELIQSGTEALTLNHQDGIDNRRGTIAVNAADLTLQTASLDNRDGKITHAGSGALTVAAAALQGGNGSVASFGALALSSENLALDGAAVSANHIRVDAGTLSNRAGKLVQNGQGAMTLNVREHTDNQGGLIAANGAVALNTTSLENRGGQILAADNGSLTVTASGQTDNHDGVLAAADSLTITTGRLNNAGGQIHAQQGAARLTSAGQLTNTAGQIAAAKDLQIAANGLDSRHGQLVGDNVSLQLGEQTLNNQNGVIAAQSRLAVSSGALNNDAGLMQSGAAMQIDTHGHALSNRQTSESGGIQAAGSLRLSSGRFDNAQGSVAAEGNAQLTIGALDNQQGLLAAGGQILAVASGAVNNDRGLIQSGGDMRLDAQQNALSNRDTRASGGVISFGNLNVTAGNVVNQKGMLAGAGETVVQAKDIDNNNGMLASEADLQLNAQKLNNRNGALSAGQDMTLTLSSKLDNYAGRIGSGGSLNANAGQLDNEQGVAAAGGDARLNIGQTDNRKGQLAAQGDFTLSGETLNNDGGLIQSGNTLTLSAGQISNRDSGKSGGIASQGGMQISASALNNDGGLLLTGNKAALDAGLFSNVAGTLAVLDTLKLTTQSDTDNRQGLIQGNGVELDTRGHLLDNREGTLNSLAAMQLTAAGLNNQSGTLAAKGDFSLQAAWLNNGSGGRVVGESRAALTLDQLLNHGGQIQILGNLLVSAAQGMIDNTLGLIRSGATATLNAASLINRDTRHAEQGIEGQNIVINSGELDNVAGSMLAGHDLSVINNGNLDNSGGELAAGGAMSLSGASLNLINTAGAAKAGRQMSVQADRLSGDGQLLSLGDMTLSSHKAINNSGEMIANGNFTLTTPGAVTNSGRLLAGARLDLTSGNLLNAATGEIAAGYTWLTVANTLTNYGLIDGNETRLVSGTLTNSGTGRIYGDYLGIQTDTLNNLAENGVAATIAGRERAEIGGRKINNLDHALIYSGGELALGGALDANGMATGMAEALNNHSSTIESAGNMALSVGQLNNINDHFTTEVALISTEQLTEYQHNGSSIRWSADEEGVFIDRNSADNLLNLNTPEKTGHNNDNFYQYDYTRTTEEEVIEESDPGKILAGGHLSISAQQVLNDKSQIVAGGTLGIAAESVNNVMLEGRRWITDEGSVTHYSRKSNKGGDSQRKNVSAYAPPTVIQSITLKPGKLEGGSRVDGSGVQIAAARRQGTNATVSGAGEVSAAVTRRDIYPGLQNIAGAERLDLGEMPTIVAGGSGLFGEESPSRQPVTLKPGQQFEVPASNDGKNMVVRVTGPDTRLPDTSLFKTHPQPEASYLVETDPRFTNNKQWLGSDYMQNAFSLNGDNMHKRLGDGYYEQRLVREQIIALTGGRYLADYRDDEAQLKGLMNAGIAFGKEHNLIPGVALTAEQMSLLTEDMVWLVNADVVLPDGTRQTVLVPQVYVRVKEGDIDGSGVLLGGRQVAMNLSGDLLNSGAINGREAVQLSAENITNKAGAINGADVSLLARTDINNIAGMITGNDSVLASAGRDINIVTTTRSAQSAAGQNSFARTTLDRVGGIYVQGEEGKLSLSAGRDITLTGGQVVNSGSLSQTVLNAGRDLNLNAVATAVSDNLTWDKDNWLKQSATQHVGSEIAGTGSVLLVAGRDVSAQAAMVSAGGSLGVGAGRDITLTAATDSSNFASHHKSTGGNGAFSKTTITTHDVVNRETAQGSAFSGASVTMQADNNLLIQGSSVAGDDDVRLAAGHNLAVTTADEQSEESHQRQEKKSGLSGTGGLGLTWGNQKLKVTDTAQDVTQQGSTVGSVNGNVSLTAGNELTVKGSNLVAGRDMALSGKQVNILAAENQSSRTHSVEQKSSGLTLALSGAAGGAINQAVTQVKSAKQGSSGRLAALQGIQAALSGVQAGQAVAMNAAQGSNPDNNNAIGVTLSWGSQSSKSEQTQRQSISQGSSAMAGNNLTIRATDGDITVRGSELQAGNNALLAASRDINMISGENTSSLTGKNESKGGTVGVGIGAGSGGWGLQISASVNKAGGKESGNGTTHTESTLTTGNHVTLKSGRDATLTGAQVSGEKITADVGRNLTLTSEQDTDKYDSKQQSAGAGGTFSIGSMSGSGSLSLSKDRMHSTYASVQEQTGLFAGSGGFDVTVGGHTQLDGAVIASTATAENNRLDTGTLGWRDTGNRADYKVEHQGAGISTGGSIGSEFAGNMANALLTGANGSGSASSTTRAAVSGGNIVIRDTANQTQDMANLSRDTAHAHGALSPVFDREKEQTRLREAQLIGEIGNQVSDIVRTQGKIAATKAATEKMATATDADRARAKADREKAHPDKTATAEDITAQMYQNFYNQAFAETGLGTGGAVQQAIQAATAAVQGLAGGNLGQAISGAAAPYLAEQIHKLAPDEASRAMAHAVVGAVTSWAAGNGAAAGAAGAVTGELMGQLVMDQLYPGKKVSELTQTEKQTISALGTLAAGLAGGLAGDSTAGVVAGAQSGKNAVENNWLSSKEARQLDKEMQDCKASGGDCNQVIQKYIDISNKNSKELQEACTGGGVNCVTWEELIQGATNVANDAHSSQFRIDEKLKDPDAAALVNYLNSTDLKFLKDNITTGDRVMDLIMTPANWPVAIMGGKAIVTNAVNNTKEQLIAVGVSSALGTGIQYGTTGELKLSDVIGTGVIGAITAGKGYNPTVTWNAAGGYYQAEINGDDPFMAALLSKAGASAGYAAGNVIKVPMDKVLNPVSKQYEWVPTGVWTITKPASQSTVPSIMGNLGDSFVSGVIGDALKKVESGDKNETK